LILTQKKVHHHCIKKVILQKIRIQYPTSRRFVDTLKKYLKDAIHTFTEREVKKKGIKEY